MNFWPFIMQHRYHMILFGTIAFALIGLQEMLKPLCIILLLSYLFNKPVTSLEPFGISRRVSAFVLIVCFMCLLTALLLFVIPLLTHKMISVIQKGPFILDNFADELEPWIRKLTHSSNPEYIEKFKNNLKDHILNNAKYGLFYILTLSRDILSVKNVIYYFGATPFLTYYLIVEWPLLSEYFVSLMPKNFRGQTRDILLLTENMFSNYIHGQTLVCLLLSILYSLGLYMVHFKNPIVVGVLIGFLTYVPYLGAMMGFGIVLLFMLADFYTFKMFIQVCTVVFVLNVLEGQIFAPYIIGKKLGISPMILILALIIGNYYFGLIGMILAYPVTATIVQTWKITREKYQL